MQYYPHNKKLYILVAVILFSLFRPEIAHTTNNTEKNKFSTIRVKQKTRRPCNAFAVDIYKKLAQKDVGNIIFSPYSLFVALSMLERGASTETKSQIDTLLHFDQDLTEQYKKNIALYKYIRSLRKNKNIELNIANALFINKNITIKKTFSDTLKSEYSSLIFSLDFLNKKDESCKYLNNWIEKETKGNIKNLIPPESIPDYLILYIVNAVYFKGEWVMKFLERNTKPRIFYTQGNKQIKTPFMYQESDFYYYGNKDLQFLGMRYSGKKVSMGIILPRKWRMLKDIEKNLTIDKLHNICIKSKRKDVQVFLPKFKLTSSYELENTLKELGMTEAFNTAADFSNIFGSKGDVWVSRILQKAMIEVNEKGSKAAAATVVEMEGLSIEEVDSRPKPIVFNANRPFLFFIQEKESKAIIFIGRVTNPKE